MPRLIDVEMELVDLFDRTMDAEAAGEPVPEALAVAVKDAVMAAAEKRDGVASFLAFVESREGELKAREDALRKQRKAIESARERFTEYVLMVMRSAGLRVACGVTSKLVVRDVESVEVVNPDALPDELCRVKTVREPDKVSIKLALQKGERIELAAGARIQTRQTLNVKPLAVKDEPGSVVSQAAHLAAQEA